MHKSGWVALVLLASCAPEKSPEQQALEDEAAIAAVEAAQEIPATPVSPQRLTFADVETYQLFGASCAFIPEGEAHDPIAYAQEKAGYMKIDGDLVRFAPDAGSGELPMGARGRYDGRAYSFVLDLGSEKGVQTGMEAVEYPAQFSLLNERDQSVYGAKGIASCGS